MLRPEFDGVPVVSGKFGFDQSYIPAIVEGLDAFLRESNAAA